MPDETTAELWGIFEEVLESELVGYALPEGRGYYFWTPPQPEPEECW